MVCAQRFILGGHHGAGLIQQSGSLAGLLSFPLLLEPLFPIAVRTRIFSASSPSDSPG
jgi:hypothetical protein